MKKVKVLVTSFLVVLSTSVGGPLLAAASITGDSSEPIIQISYQENGEQVIEGMISGIDQDENQSNSWWLALYSHIRYPSQGGKWEYGFWNAKVRSYYTVNKKHGSTMKYNGNTVRSIDTASNQTSIAEK